MLNFKSLFFLAALLFLIGMAAACGNAGESQHVDEVTAPPDSSAEGSDSATDDTNSNAPEETDPSEYTGGETTLLIADRSTGVKGNEALAEAIFNPVQEKYPEITVEISQETVEYLITAGTAPDIVLTSNPFLHELVDIELTQDLSEMITKYAVDLEAFDPIVIEEIRRISDDNFYGLPFTMNYGATLLNLDIFDRFGVDYPEDGMTWEEFYELASHLTRMDDGVQFYGTLQPPPTEWLRQYTLPVVNPETNQSELTTEPYVNVISTLIQFFEIPDYVKDGVAGPTGGNPVFSEQITAMWPNWIGVIVNDLSRYELPNWDLTTYPTIPDKPDVGKQVDFHMAVVNKVSEKKEAAYQVLLSITSEEVQADLSRIGRLTPLVNEEIRSLYAADNNIFEGKNLQGIFSVQSAPMPFIHKHNSQIEGLLNGEMMHNIVIEHVDVNTALRQIEEKANAEILIEE